MAKVTDWARIFQVAGGRQLLMTKETDEDNDPVIQMQMRIASTTVILPVVCQSESARDAQFPHIPQKVAEDFAEHMIKTYEQQHGPIPENDYKQ